MNFKVGNNLLIFPCIHHTTNTNLRERQSQEALNSPYNTSSIYVSCTVHMIKIVMLRVIYSWWHPSSYESCMSYTESLHTNLKSKIKHTIVLHTSTYVTTALLECNVDCNHLKIVVKWVWQPFCSQVPSCFSRNRNSQTKWVLHPLISNILHTCHRLVHASSTLHLNSTVAVWWMYNLCNTDRNLLFKSIIC